jgi:hypothetical protein
MSHLNLFCSQYAKNGGVGTFEMSQEPVPLMPQTTR